jgi:hypothetical protein
MSLNNVGDRATRMFVLNTFWLYKYTKRYHDPSIGYKVGREYFNRDDVLT